jgi:dolichyl-phosphate-mannose-protein mannosyltransferase
LSAPRPPALDRRDGILALLLAFVAALFRLPRLGVPNEEMFDEVYHARTALQYLVGESPTEWVHPPTAKLIVAVGVWLFGYEPWAWRLLPALAGIALAPVFYLLARHLLASRRAAVLASVLLLCDGVYLVQSRVAMTNIFAVLFQLGAALFVVRAAESETLRVRDMLGAGVCLGLALSTRWTSLWATGFLGLTLLVARRERLLRAREALLVPWALVAVPVLIYVVSYLPWVQQGNDLSALPDLQQAIWRYHATLQAEHPYFSKWYTWPWLVRPTWYYFHQDTPAKTVAGIVAIGNPMLWWVSMAAAFWGVFAAARPRLVDREGDHELQVRVSDPRLLFCALGYFFLYLPWGLSPRTLNYSHYLFEAIPYACLCLGTLLDRHWDGRWRGAARGYVVLVAVVFLFFVPFLLAIPVPTSWYYHELWRGGPRPWTWFPTWV